MKKVFIDGSAGTTGLRIRERLAERKDLTILTLPEELRKDPEVRAKRLNEADVSFLCLPDAASREAVAMVKNPEAILIDTSTAHRVSSDWMYGMPELPGQRERIRSAKRIANPGCHASGFIALVAPLVAAGIVKKEARLSCFSLTGYSGGGKKMIADYENPERAALYDAPRQYGLNQTHKHLPEMAVMTGLQHSPVFCPIVAPYYAGMEVTVPLTEEDTTASIEIIQDIYRKAYVSGMIHLNETQEGENGFLSAEAFAGRDDMEVSIFGQEGRIILVSRFDNLGKGASGAAIQNMNLALGLEEKTGLVEG